MYQEVVSFPCPRLILLPCMRRLTACVACCQQYEFKVPPDQLKLTQEELNADVSHYLRADNPNVSKNITRYNYSDGVFKLETSIQQLAVHFSMEGCASCFAFCQPIHAVCAVQRVDSYQQRRGARAGCVLGSQSVWRKEERLDAVRGACCWCVREFRAHALRCGAVC